MAFAVPLVFPAISEVAGAVGLGVAEATGSGVLGGLAEGTVIEKAGELAEGALEGVGDLIFGTENVENFKNHAYDNFEKAKNFGLFTMQDYSEEDIVRFIREKNFRHEDIAKHTNNFINDFTRESLSDTPENVLEKIKRVNPMYYYLASKVLDLTGPFVVPTDEDYVKVSNTYTGEVFFKNLTLARETGDGIEFYTQTENGEVLWKYPEYNNYPVVPTIYGTWVGINSINNSVPVYGTVSVDEIPEGYRGLSGVDEAGNTIWQSQLDRIAHVHDCMYHDYGSFNRFADYVLINYIEIGLREGLFIFPNERDTALIALNYFSTVGRVVRKIYGDDVSEGIIQNLYGTFANVKLTDEHIEILKENTKNNLTHMPLEQVSTGYKPESIQLAQAINSMSFEAF